MGLRQVNLEISQAHSPTFPSLTYVTAHSTTLSSLYLHHSSFSNPSVTDFSLTSPGEPLMLGQKTENVRKGFELIAMAAMGISASPWDTRTSDRNQITIHFKSVSPF